MRSTILKPSIGNYTDHGWSEDGKAIWSEIHIPEEIREILYANAVNNDATKDDEEGEEEEEEEADGDNGGDGEEEDEDIELCDYS